MSLPSMEAKFGSTCEHCGAKIKKGDTIYKVNDHWCTNQSCKNLTVATSQTIEESTKIPEYEKIHDEIWKFATVAAGKIFAGSDFESKKSRNILAQVFYKKCFDAKIHGIRQNKP